LRLTPTFLKKYKNLKPMKLYSFLLAGLFLLLFQLGYCQSFTFQGGIKPNNLLGTHFSVKADVLKKGKWIYSLNYSLVKYKDSFAKPGNKQPNFHIENERDQTFIPFPGLDRGFPIQKEDRDFRPRDLFHRFSVFLGRELYDDNNFSVKVFLGPNLSLDRNILYYIAYDFTEVTINEGDEVQIIPYHDLQIYRDWDIGIGGRVDLEYKVFKNVYIGVGSQMYFDLIGEKIDLIVGGGLTFNF